jgi:hypothetical protein
MFATEDVSMYSQRIAAGGERGRDILRDCCMASLADEYMTRTRRPAGWGIGLASNKLAA